VEVVEIAVRDTGDGIPKETLDRIVENLLRFARPAQPRLSEASLVECVARVLALVGEEARERGVRIETSIDQDIPHLYMDEEQIVQVLLNLVHNAFQAMSDGGAVTLGVRRTRKPPYVRRSAGRRASDRTAPPEPVRPVEVVEIAVRDTGDGIPKETMDRIFDPFFTTRRDGTGLGLSISQSIIREHGGFITIDSTVGRGTTVSIYLPLEKRHGQRRRA
jgi:signal transduction histidine kinase